MRLTDIDPEKVMDAYPEMTGLAKTVTRTLNCMSNDTMQGRLAFCLAMERDHRTLQQTFTRLCVAWLLHAGEPGYRTDLRNEATHKLAVALKPILEEAHLPFI
jgi:hypothetical protein